MLAENPYSRAGIGYAQAWERMSEIPYPPSLEAFCHELKVLNRGQYVTPMQLAVELARQYAADCD
jgi:hypothetical protein